MLSFRSSVNNDKVICPPNEMYHPSVEGSKKEGKVLLPPVSYRLGLGLERNKRKVLKSGMLPSAVKSHWSSVAPVAMAVHWKRARIDQLTGKRPPVVLGSPVSIHPIGSHFNFGVRHVLHHVRWALTWFEKS